MTISHRLVASIGMRREEWNEAREWPGNEIPVGLARTLVYNTL